MSWPTPQDYQEAMQNPRINLADAELQKGRAEEDMLGFPRPFSGGFVTAYKVACPSRTYAIRCFLRVLTDQQKRYAAISNQLAISKFPFTTLFEFLLQGIRIAGKWYPVMKMEWVQGESLIQFVEKNLNSPQKLISLGVDIVEIVRALNRAGVSHGDLQHGNILVANGKPKLIDYDGMYVPALKGWQTHEAGHPNYQLMRDETDFGPNLDNFSAWVIYLSLRALSVRPSLWTQFQGGDDCLLFRRKDFEHPDQSQLLRELKRFPENEIRQFSMTFESLLTLSPLQVPMIDPGSPGTSLIPKPDVDWIYTHIEPGPARQQAATQAATFNLVALWGEIARIPRPDSLFQVPQTVSAMPTPWPFTAAPPVPPSLPGILSAPPPFPPLELPSPRFQPTSVPMNLDQKTFGIIAVVFLALVPLMMLLGTILQSWRTGLVFGTAFILGTAFFAILYLVRERIRRQEQDEVNWEYEQERKERKELQRQHVERCQKRLKEQQDDARRKYESAKAAWNTAMLPYSREASRRRDGAARAKADLQSIKKRWDSASFEALQQFDARKAELERLKNELNTLDVQHASEWKSMLVKARDVQLAAHLGHHLIKDAAIEDIGPARKRTLELYGVKTALDIEYARITKIPHFKNVRAATLIGWRRNVEASFIFKSANAVPPYEKQAFEYKYDVRRRSLQEQMKAGEQELKRISKEAENKLGSLIQQIKSLTTISIKAEADLTAIPKGI